MEIPRRNPDYPTWVRWCTGIVAILGLLCIFLFQRLDWSVLLPVPRNPPINVFLINRSVRFVLNDVFAVLLVMAVFGRISYLWISVWVQLFGVFFVLVPYVLLKLEFPYYNGPMISFLHRLVLNPLLIYLLIFFFWYHERRGVGSKNG